MTSMIMLARLKFRGGFGTDPAANDRQLPTAIFLWHLGGRCREISLYMYILPYIDRWSSPVQNRITLYIDSQGGQKITKSKDN